MKKDQVINAMHHKGRAIITDINKVKVTIKWILGADGEPMPDGVPITRTHSIRELQKEIDEGNLIVSNPDNPNLLFLMRKLDDVHS